MGLARDKYREVVAEALTNWRLGCKLNYGDWGPERAVICAGVGEIAALRLQEAFLPMLQSLARIEARARILADLKSDPYAPSRVRPDSPLKISVRNHGNGTTSRPRDYIAALGD